MTNTLKPGDKVKLTDEYLAAPYASKELTGVYEVVSNVTAKHVLVAVDDIRTRHFHHDWLERIA